MHYGDDFICSRLPDTIPVARFVDAMRHLGMTVSSPVDKSLLPTTGPVTSASFLSRSFRLIEGRCYAPLSVSSLENIVRYYPKKMQLESYLEQVYPVVLSEAAQHGEDYFEATRLRYSAFYTARAWKIPPCHYWPFSSFLARIRDDPFVLALAPPRDDELTRDVSVTPPIRLRSVPLSRGAVPLSGGCDPVALAGEDRVGALRYSGAPVRCADLPLSRAGRLVDGIVHMADPVLSAFGLSHPPRPDVVDTSGAYAMSMSAPVDGRSNAFPLGSSVHNSVDAGVPVSVTPTFADLGAMRAIMTTGYTSSSDVRGTVLIDTVPTPTTYDLVTLEGGVVMVLHPAGHAALPFVFWRCKSVTIRVTVAKAPLHTGSLVLVGAYNTAIPSGTDVFSATSSLVTPFMAELDLSAQSEFDVTLPWQSPVAALKNGLPQLGVSWVSGYEQIAAWHVQLIVKQPLRNAVPGVASAHVAMSWCFDGLELFVRDSTVFTYLSLWSENAEDSDGTVLGSEPVALAGDSEFALLAAPAPDPVEEPTTQPMREMSLLPQSDNLVDPVRLSRYVTIFDGVWATTVPFTLDIFRSILSSVSMQSLLSYASWIRADLSVRLTVSGSPTIQGMGILYAIPAGAAYGTSITNFQATPTWVTSFPHVTVLASSTRTYELRLPYAGSYSMWLLTDTIFAADTTGKGYHSYRDASSWVLSFYNLFAPANTSGGDVVLNLFLQAAFVNPIVSVPNFLPCAAPLAGEDGTYHSASATQQEVVSSPLPLGFRLPAHLDVDLVFGSRIDSFLALLHSPTPHAVPFTTTTASSTWVPFLIEDITVPYALVDSFDPTQNQVLSVWDYVLDLFTFVRGSTEVSLDLTGSAILQTYAAPSHIINGCHGVVSPTSAFAWLDQPIQGVATSPYQPVVSLARAEPNDPTCAFILAATAASGFSTVNPRLSQVLSVRVPHHLPFPWVFRAPNTFSTSPYTTSITFQESVHFQLVSRSTFLGSLPTGVTWAWRTPGRAVHIAAADDFRLAHFRPHTGLAPSTFLSSWQANRRAPYYYPVV
jgi:hypothetical protein